MIRGLGHNLEIQGKLSYKFIIMKIVSVCFYNSIVNVGRMLICLSWILAFYLTPRNRSRWYIYVSDACKLTSYVIPGV